MDNIFLSQTNWVDLIVVIFLIRGGYVGLKEGLSVELFKTLGAIAATALSLLYYKQLGEWLVFRSFLTPQAANIIAFIVLVFSLLILFNIVRLLIFRVLHLELFGSLERFGGFTLGMARSIIFASLLLFPLTLLPVPYIQESVDNKSLSGPYLKIVAPKVVDFLSMFRPKHNIEDINEERGIN